MKASARTSGWAFVALTLGLAFCGQAPEQPQAKLAPLQPNRSSELAIAMRAMDGELVSLLARHAEADDWEGASLSELDLTRMMPTDSSMLVEGYTALAIAFSKHVEAFNAAPSSDTYTDVVSGCLSCHMQACPGPIERINKRQLGS
jgi:hypothetical protein